MNQRITEMESTFSESSARSSETIERLEREIADARSQAESELLKFNQTIAEHQLNLIKEVETRV